MMQAHCKWDKYVKWLILIFLFYIGCHVVRALVSNWQ